MNELNNVCYNGYYKYTFRLSPDITPDLICFNSKIWQGREILEYGYKDMYYNKASSTVKVFAVNYNVLHIMSGMGGLAYSN